MLRGARSYAPLKKEKTKMRFSSRNKYKSTEVPITIREAAPKELQEFIIQTAYHFEITPKPLRKLVCRILRKSPDGGNWSEFPNIDMEIHQLLEECEWFFIYDIIEELFDSLGTEQATQFKEDINGFFRSNGIGWQLDSGEIKYRGDDKFEEIKSSAVEILDAKGKTTSKHEIKEAINDLSKKPEADITGAIQHSLAGLECVVREVTGNTKATLGKLINDNPDIWSSSRHRTRSFVNYAANFLAFSCKNFSFGDILPREV